MLPSTIYPTIANFARLAKNMSRPPQNAPFATLENTKVPTMLQLPLVCRVTKDATLQTTAKMLPSMNRSTIAHFAQSEKNLCPLLQPVAFVVLVNFKTKQESLDPFAKRAPPIHLSQITVSRMWLTMTLKIAMPVPVGPSQIQETNHVQRVLRGNGCLQITKV
jgi:hypothetical protein